VTDASPAANALTLEWASREVSPGDGSTRSVDFLDFLVDDHSLLRWIAWSSDKRTPSADAPTRVTPLSHVSSPADRKATVDRLLLRRQPDAGLDGRVPLYVCPMCGDLGCGAVAARVRRGPGGTIEWVDFAVVDGRGEARDLGLPPLRFGVGAYRDALSAASAL
jgi:hypothetical protein